MLKIESDLLSPPFSFIFDSSIEKPIFPDASSGLFDVASLFKKEVRTSSGISRPVSVLPTASKIFERFWILRFLTTCLGIFHGCFAVFARATLPKHI